MQIEKATGMTLTRRGFLGSLVAGVVGAAAVAELHGIAAVLPQMEAPVIETLTPMQQFALLTREGLRILNESLAEPGYYLAHGAERLGQGPVWNQFGVTLDPWDSYDVPSREAFIKRTLRPTMTSLAYRINDSHASAFGVPELPRAVIAAEVVRDTQRGTALRALIAYDVMSDQHIMRYDVLVG